MSGCTGTGRPGCHSGMCRAAHFSLRRLPVTRYPSGTDGLPDITAQPENGWICGLVSYKAAKSGSLGIPGITGGQRSVQLVVAAGSLEPAVMAGDLITVNGAVHKVFSVSRDDRLTAGLTAAEEAE